MLHVAAPCMCRIILDQTESIRIVDIRYFLTTINTLPYTDYLYNYYTSMTQPRLHGQAMCNIYPMPIFS